MKSLQAKFDEVKAERDRLQSNLELRTNELEKIRTDLIDADAKVSVVTPSMKMIHIICVMFFPYHFHGARELNLFFEDFSTYCILHTGLHNVIYMLM